MADVANPTPPKRSSRLPLVVGLLAAVGAGAGGYYAVTSGKILARTSAAEYETQNSHTEVDIPNVSFVPIQPLIVTLGGSANQHLRFEGHLEVEPGSDIEVQAMMPRVMDVLNSYLRAIELTDLRDPAALLRVRAQMLRRIQVVTGEGRVRDLLITTFLIS